MQNKKLDQLVTQLENYLECWKLLNHYISLARGKKFSPEDENQFLEVKAIVVQELELIVAAIEFTSPSREEVHAFLAATPSLRYLSESSEGALRGLENQWHKIYVGLAGCPRPGQGQAAGDREPEFSRRHVQEEGLIRSADTFGDCAVPRLCQKSPISSTCRPYFKF